MTRGVVIVVGEGIVTCNLFARDFALNVRTNANDSIQTMVFDRLRCIAPPTPGDPRFNIPRFESRRYLGQLAHHSVQFVYWEVPREKGIDWLGVRDGDIVVHSRCARSLVWESQMLVWLDDCRR